MDRCSLWCIFYVNGVFWCEPISCSLLLLLLFNILLYFFLFGDLSGPTVVLCALDEKVPGSILDRRNLRKVFSKLVLACVFLVLGSKVRCSITGNSLVVIGVVIARTLPEMVKAIRQINIMLCYLYWNVYNFKDVLQL